MWNYVFKLLWNNPSLKQADNQENMDNCYFWNPFLKVWFSKFHLADPIGVVLQAPCLFVDVILKIVSSISVEDVADYSSRHAGGVVWTTAGFSYTVHFTSKNCLIFAVFSRHSLRIYYHTTEHFSIFLLFKFYNINILYAQTLYVRYFYMFRSYTFRRYTLSFILLDVIRSGVIRSVIIRIEFICSVGDPLILIKESQTVKNRIKRKIYCCVGVSKCRYIELLAWGAATTYFASASGIK